MKIGSFIKTPAERKRYAVDYSDWLGTGELVNGVTFTVTPASGTPVTPIIVDASSFAGGLVVVFFVNYGDLNIAYTLDIKITTDGGQTKEDTIAFVVRSA